jgi:hypothetical protein
MRKQHEKPIIKGDTKQCTRCKNFKNFSEFHKFGKSRDGYKHYCKQCVKEYDLVKNDTKRVFPRKMNGELIHCRRCEQYLPRSKFWSKNTYCKDCQSAIGHINNLNKYKLTRDQYVDLEKKQGGLCAICKKPEQKRKRLSVDHDHNCCPTNKNYKQTCGSCIRGLICFKCNIALGATNDSIKILNSMISYLKRDL